MTSLTLRSQCEEQHRGLCLYITLLFQTSLYYLGEMTTTRELLEIERRLKPKQPSQLILRKLFFGVGVGVIPWGKLLRKTSN